MGHNGDRLAKEGESMKPNDVFTIEEIAGMVKPLVEKHNVEKAIVFGSYARGTATPQSDLDVILYGGDGFRGKSLFAIAEELHELSGKRVNVYERRELADDSPLLAAIDQEGVVL